MIEIERAHEDLNFTSERISEQTRTISLSIIAIVWVLLIGGEDKPILPSVPDARQLIVAGFLALLTLFLDYAQYAVGFINTKLLVDKAELENLNSISFKKEGFLYNCRSAFFWSKQLLVVVAGLTLIFTVAEVFSI
ncbi:MAG TPA: hypothetical protein VEF76_04340 [Patescibacteria group bacterium]|nr:hypothetical protein [Patescibacteria group bacterium]